MFNYVRWQIQFNVISLSPIYPIEVLKHYILTLLHTVLWKIIGYSYIFYFFYKIIFSNIKVNKVIFVLVKLT